MSLHFQLRRDDFLAHYHKRSNVESTFSMIKAKFPDHVRSKTPVAMVNEVLCKLICHDICVLARYELPPVLRTPGLGVMMGPGVADGTTQFQPGVQARGGEVGSRSGSIGRAGGA